MGPHVPTQQRAFAPLNYFPKMLWITGQGILYQWNSSTLCWACTPDLYSGPYQGEKVEDGRLCMPPLSQCSRKKASGPRRSHTTMRSSG